VAALDKSEPFPSTALFLPGNNTKGGSVGRRVEDSVIQINEDSSSRDRAKEGLDAFFG
jgi:hypothetical protein